MINNIKIVKFKSDFYPHQNGPPARARRDDIHGVVFCVVLCVIITVVTNPTVFSSFTVFCVDDNVFLERAARNKHSHADDDHRRFSEIPKRPVVRHPDRNYGRRVVVDR